mmetsp:Transcript_89523/g.252223  ORF Transcript_89523/g.252223 Transcript_89523/m.252223 type:complete len:273 (+) Transcript_89523:91-909(+)
MVLEGRGGGAPRSHTSAYALSIGGHLSYVRRVVRRRCALLGAVLAALTLGATAVGAGFSRGTIHTTRPCHPAHHAILRRCSALLAGRLRVRSGRGGVAVAVGSGFDELAAWADEFLRAWDKEDRVNSRAGNTPFGLTPAGAIPEADRLRAAVRVLVQRGSSVRLGVMADNGYEAVKALKSWTEALELPVRGVGTLGEDGRPVDKKEVAAGPVYLKYQSSPSAISGSLQDAPTAFMKRHIGETRGVTVNPEFQDEELRIYGDLPLALFDNTEG